MRVVRHPIESDWAALSKRPSQHGLRDIGVPVREILEAVRIGGDTAVSALTRRFDGHHISDALVSPAQLAAALGNLGGELRGALEVAIRNIEKFHVAQSASETSIETTPGVTCWRKRVPIKRIGCYVPGGSAPLLSSVLMMGVPARIAGCSEVVFCSPPFNGAAVNDSILATIALLGFDTVYCIGGAQAIAAMAYGTESIPQVHKIFGPGNAWVNTAKKLVAAEGVAIDMPAGPTELLIIADASSDVAYLAADVLAQAEHGPDSQIMVVTLSEKHATELPSEIERQLADLPRRDIAVEAVGNSCIVVVETLDAALAFANHYAPEHLSLQCANARVAAEQVTVAGSVFVGRMTPEAFGDYASGTNHILPTAGTARAWSGVSVDSFCTYITFQEATAEGLTRLGPTVETLAGQELLDGHARSVSIRQDQRNAES